MSYIFLSYTNKDVEIAHKIAEAIEHQGYSVWWDRIIPPGKAWEEYIEKKLDAANCVVVLWSHESIKSKWVKIEASEGDRRGILIPVLIEDVEQPLAFRRLEAAKLIYWDETSFHQEFQLLLKSIKGSLGNPVAKTKILEPPEQELDGINREEFTIKDKGNPALKTPEQEVEEIKKEKLTLKPKYTPVLNRPLYEIMQERMVEIPAGEFVMGDDRNGCREVTISAFQMDKFPVTQYIYEMVMDENPSHFEGKDRPVENVNWFDAIEFCNELSRNIGLQEAYEVNGKTVGRKLESDGYRLPTEAEWEYACRGNTTDKRYGKLDEIAWYHKNSKKETHEVGKRIKNKFNLYDMLGNVKEWCFDRYGDYLTKPETDPTGPDTGPTRIMRGGSWFNFNNEIKCPHRAGDWPKTSGYNIGFRLVLPLNQRSAKNNKPS